MPTAAAARLPFPPTDELARARARRRPAPAAPVTACAGCGAGKHRPLRAAAAGLVAGRAVLRGQPVCAFCYLELSRGLDLREQESHPASGLRRAI